MLEFELILPAYNESQSLKNIVARTSEAAIAAGFHPTNFQLFLVNNGSTDDSSQTLEKLKSSELGRWFRIVDIRKNQGYGFGILEGLKQTSAPFIGWSHADEQCDPADAFRALAQLKSQSAKFGLVKGTRSGRDPKDIFVSNFFAFLASLILGLNLKEINAQPKVFQRELLEKLTNPPKSFEFDLYALYQAKKNQFLIESIPVLFPRRPHGLSHWSASFFGRYKMIFRTIRTMIRISLREGRLCAK